MALYNSFDQFVEDVHNGVHNLGTGVLKVAVTTAANAPSASLDAVLADVTVVANLETSADSTTITTTSSTETAGLYSLVLADKVITASTGDIGPFQWVIIYNDTPTSPADPLIAYFDYGSEITVLQNETFTLDFGTNLFTSTVV